MEPTSRVRYTLTDGSAREELVSIQTLWAVGSFAGGSPVCGNLDLVVQLDSDTVDICAVNRVFFKKRPGVRLFRGTPSHNSAGVHFDHAVLIWARGTPWHHRIESITPHPQYTKKPQPTDITSLRQEQLAVLFKNTHDPLFTQKQGLLHDLLDAVHRNELTLQFIPLSTLCPSHLSPEQHVQLGRVMKSKAEMSTFVLDYLNMVAPEHECQLNYIEWRAGGTAVVMGSAPLGATPLYHPSLSRLAIMPDLNTRGPNGLLEIKRGAAHPLSKEFDGLRAYVLIADGNMLPGKTDDTPTGMEVRHLDIFSSEALAQEYCNLDEDLPATAHIARLDGVELLDAMAGFDTLTLMYSSLPTIALTSDGVWAMEEDNVIEFGPQAIEFIQGYCAPHG